MPGTSLGSLPVHVATLPDYVFGAEGQFVAVDISSLALDIASGSVYLGAEAPSYVAAFQRDLIDAALPFEPAGVMVQQAGKGRIFLNMMNGKIPEVRDVLFMVLATHPDNIKEKLDGKDSAVTFVEVTIEPGKEGVPHRHPGPAFVYVIEGEYELGIDDKPTKKFNAGEAFVEPSGCLHRVSRNPSTKTRTRLIAVVVHPRDAKEIAVPEKMKESHR